MKRLLLILIVVRISLAGISQEIITSSGDYYSNEDITLEWTIGEGVTETYEENEIILNQGFQQNIEIIQLPTKNNNLDDIKVTIYPNPAGEIVNIDISTSDDFELNIDLYDIQGNNLYTVKKNNGQPSIQIELPELPAGEYILKIYSRNNNINKAFKIIKYQ